MTVELPYFIITRLGIGIADKTRMLYRIQLLGETLLRSMVAQTDQRFRWLLVVDERIDPDAEAELNSLLSPYSHFEVQKQDPIRTKSLSPLSEGVLRTLKAHARVMASRIDDDDLISRDYVCDVRAVAEKAIASSETTFPIALTMSNGYEASLEHMRVRPFHRPWIAHSIATVCETAEFFFTPYSVRHLKVGEEARNRGGIKIEVENARPLWVYLRRSGSDSIEFGGIPVPHGEQISSAQFDDLFQNFGITPGWADRVRHLYAMEPKPPPLAEGPGLPERKPRLIAKGNLLSAISRLEAQIKAAVPSAGQDKLSSIRDTLVTAFYSL